MTTVLRDRTLRAFEDFLREHGTRDHYVSKNLKAANDWFIELQEAFPRTDNEPVQWIKEMIKKDPET